MERNKAIGARAPGSDRSKPRLFGLAVLAVAVLAGAIYYHRDTFERYRTRTPQAQERVTLGLARESLAALAMIAHARGFFAQAGIDVQLKEYKSGQLALAGFLAGETEIATTADTPIVFESLQRQDFNIIATIGSSDNEPRIIARRDFGISKPEDLRGRRVATQRASAVHFFLHMFLLQNGMTTSDVDLAFMKPDELVQAFADGRIDAFSMREPYISQAAKTVGDNAVIFAKPGLYRKTFNLVATPDLVKTRQHVARRVVQGLVFAESFALEYPDEAIAIVAKALGSQPAEIAVMWPDANLKVSLDQSLLIGLEDQARWIIGNRLSNVSHPPSYLELVHLDALKAVDPILVSVIH